MNLHGAKTEFQDRCRLLLRNGYYPSASRLGYVQHGISTRQSQWRADVLNEWLDSHPDIPLPGGGS